MKTQDIFRKAGAILSEINEQYEYLSSATENLNDLELELLSANADFFAEHVRVLKKVNAASSANTAAVSVPLQNEEPVDQYPIESVQIVNTPPPPIDDETEPKPLIKQETPEAYFSFFPQEEPVVEVEEEIHLVETEPVSEHELPQEPAPAFRSDKPDTISERPVIPESANEPLLTENVAAPEEVTNFVKEEREVFEKEEVINIDDLRAASEPPKAPTLNELIAAQLTHNTNAEGGFNKKPVVTDLKSIINLNDKLTFIKDLFNGYSLAYSEAIEILNRFDSLDAADNFLKTNYASKNNWAAKQATVDKFYELLNRRFTK